MSEFVLNYGTVDAEIAFDALDEFTQGYLEAAFWLACDWGDMDEYGNPNQSPDWTIADLAPEAIERAKAHCADFQLTNAADLEATGAGDHRSGVDFWMTRNRHGAGFWDRGYPETIGDRLTHAAHAYGETDLYRGDDGRLYLS